MNEIKEKIKKLILGYSHFTPSFSQAGEDMILRNLLRKIQAGFYVDVGAHHPLSGSNTHYFYRFQNWRGINIEPNPEHIGFFEKERPEDINLNIGISGQSAMLDYYVLKDGSGMNTFSLDFVEKFGGKDAIEKTIKIQTHPLKDVLDKYLPKDKCIDLLTVDVEGLDMEVLQSNNWNKYRPKTIAIEMDINDFETNPINEFLRNLDYVLVGMTPVNTQIVMSCIYFDNKLYKSFKNY